MQAAPSGSGQDRLAPVRRGWRPRLAYARDEGAGSQRAASRARRILIVEDDFLVATQMETALRDGGFESAGIAATAEEALALAGAQRPALCIMDIRLAGRSSGIDTAIELFRSYGVRCIFATAHFDLEARRRAAPAAPLGWLQKPYSMTSLVAMVRQALDELRGR